MLWVLIRTALDFRLEQFKLILINSSPDTSYQVSCQLAFRFRRSSAKYIFKNGDYLKDPTETILGIFHLYFLLSIKSIGVSVQERRREMNCQDGGHDGHLAFPIGMMLAVFDKLSLTDF